MNLFIHKNAAHEFYRCQIFATAYKVGEARFVIGYDFNTMIYIDCYIVSFSISFKHS